jgi:hypothetical protein
MAFVVPVAALKALIFRRRFSLYALFMENLSIENFIQLVAQANISHTRMLELARPLFIHIGSKCKNNTLGASIICSFRL